MKIAFFGTHEFSANILKSLMNNFKEKIEIKLAVSQPDKPVGRKKILEKTPVKLVAEKNNIEVLQPEKLKGNTDFFEKLNSLDLDFIVVVAYGKIVPKEVLDAPKFGCINIHGSILPKYRGASPIQESIKFGDKKTGLTIMYMAEGMDTGDILKIEEVEILEDDKTPDLFKKFEEIGPKLLADTLEGILDGKILGQKQDDSKASYCSKISKTDGEINFEKNSGEEIYNKFRAYYPWPGIYSFYKGKKFNVEDCKLINSPLQGGDAGKAEGGEVIKLSKKEIGIVCKNNKILILKQVKLEGKKSVNIIDFVNGNKDFLDYKF